MHAVGASGSVKGARADWNVIFQLQAMYVVEKEIDIKEFACFPINPQLL